VGSGFAGSGKVLGEGARERVRVAEEVGNFCSTRGTF